MTSRRPIRDQEELDGQHTNRAHCLGNSQRQTMRLLGDNGPDCGGRDSGVQNVVLVTVHRHRIANGPPVIAPGHHHGKLGREIDQRFGNGGRPAQGIPGRGRFFSSFYQDLPLAVVPGRAGLQDQRQTEFPDGSIKLGVVAHRTPRRMRNAMSGQETFFTQPILSRSMRFASPGERSDLAPASAEQRLRRFRIRR